MGVVQEKWKDTIDEGKHKRETYRAIVKIQNGNMYIPYWIDMNDTPVYGPEAVAGKLDRKTQKPLRDGWTNWVYRPKEISWEELDEAINSFFDYMEK